MTNYESVLNSIMNKLTDLEKKVDQLNTELNVVKSRPMTVEYKFDQLKVETLEGTLNIGIQPTGPTNGSIDDFSVSQQQHVGGSQVGLTPHFADEITKRVHEYLDKEAPIRIENMLQQRNQELDPGYVHFMINDVRSQIEQRIPYYYQAIAEQFPQLVANQDAFLEQIILRMCTDMDTAFLGFLNTVPKHNA